MELFCNQSWKKSPCDGIGGTVKRITAAESLRRLYKEQILSAEVMFNFCKDKINGITFFYSSKEEIEETRSKNKKRYEQVSTIPGTRSLHQFIAIDKNTVGIKRCSEEKTFAKQHRFNKEVEAVKPFNMKVSMYVAVVYDNAWWLGNILEIDEVEQDVKIKFLHPRGPASSFFWPTKDDFCYSPFENILCEITTPQPQSIFLRQYLIDSNDIALISNLWSKFNLDRL